MEDSNTLRDKKGNINEFESNNILETINSSYILKKIFHNLTTIKFYKIIKYNKKTQNRINLSVFNYKKYSEAFTPIEIEIITVENVYGKFMKEISEEERPFYHIYFNDNKENMSRNYFTKEDKVKKINIIIDYQIKSLDRLFYYYCKSIKSINFKKFYRNNINDMSYMFHGCSAL